LSLSKHTFSVKIKGKENICQIMWPSYYIDGLTNESLHRKTTRLAQVILGEDMAFDFDMLIAKVRSTAYMVHIDCMYISLLVLGNL